MIVNIAKAIAVLLRNNQRLRRMDEDARKTVRQLYRSERVARLVLRTFEEILSKSLC